MYNRFYLYANPNFYLERLFSKRWQTVYVKLTHENQMLTLSQKPGDWKLTAASPVWDMCLQPSHLFTRLIIKIELRLLWLSDDYILREVQRSFGCLCITCLKRTSVSVQYLCFCSPPCSRTTDLGCSVSLAFRATQRRRRFSENSAADTLRVSFPNQNTAFL